MTPAQCVGHWQADSLEILLDPRGTASPDLKDTANTFKLGVFPFSNDPTGSNGTGANGPAGNGTPTTTRATRRARSPRR